LVLLASFNHPKVASFIYSTIISPNLFLARLFSAGCRSAIGLFRFLSATPAAASPLPQFSAAAAVVGPLARMASMPKRILDVVILAVQFCFLFHFFLKQNFLF